ncbi:hypothetical protein M2164_005941 [Streptomyces sp. SAI-208]|uniref:hypothetical protein n=1 Tax=Streptomyces sp. SAI-208 TaxID=2940550 RepID=UPI0024738EE5|nr:hypothetical protein [Streptomyces sp. SAI-208]MDH6610306.1 hypothetical protein [Streptomyces sp. SAI-208]
MPLLTSLVDNFNDGVIGPDWGNAYGGVTESGGKAHVPCTTSYAGYQTNYTWTLAGASFYVSVTNVPAASTATEAYTSLFVNAPGIGDNSNALYGTRIGFVINVVTNQLKMSSESGYFDAGAVSIAYSATTHKFLRLRETGGTVFWDTSPDGSTWTNRRTLATPAWVTSSTNQCALDMSAHRDAGTVDEAAYDLFNTLSNGATVVATGSGTFTTNVTGTPLRAATGTATATLDTAATATLKATLYATGSGRIDIDATAVLSGATDLSDVDFQIGKPTRGWAVSTPWR